MTITCSMFTELELEENLVGDIELDEQLVQPIHEDFSVRIEELFEDVPAV